MGILQLPQQAPGLVGVTPNFKYMVTTDSLATITTAGYLNQVSLESNPVATTDILQILYAFNQQTNVGTYGAFTVAISAATGQITLTQWVDAGNVLLPVTTGDFAVFNGTTGQIKDAGYLPSNAAKTRVVMANGAVGANRIAVYTDTTGTIGTDASTAINAGNVQAGLNGTAGKLTTIPPTLDKGTLSLQAADQSGNTNSVITNAALGQATTFTIPDPGATTAKFLLDTGANAMAAGSSIVAAKVNGSESSNAVTASGMAGVITTSSLTTAGGANYAITWTNTFITSTSIILLTIEGGTNTTQNITLVCTRGTGTATLTIYNNTAATALNGTILISYLVM